jgi:hypothetical protein
MPIRCEHKIARLHHHSLAIDIGKCTLTRLDDEAKRRGDVVMGSRRFPRKDQL